MKFNAKSPAGILIIVIGIVIVLIVLQRAGLLTPVENATTYVLKPIQGIFSQTADRTKNLLNYFRRLQSLSQENESLKNERAALTEENLTLRQDIENLQLAQQEKEFITGRQLQSVTAEVIGRSAEGSLPVVIINRGGQAGIKKDYPAIVQNGILVGKVFETTDHIAKILLLPDNQSEISAMVKNEHKSPGIVVGQYSIALKMELIPQDQEIHAGDLVTTSGLEPFIPADLLIGSINQVVRKEGELFQQATIDPAANYQQLTVVSVIVPSDD